MHNPKQFIEIKGEKRGLLITPSLYKVLKERGLNVETTSEMQEIQSAYIKMIYAALINYWEVQRYDRPDTPDFDIELLDVEVWAMTEKKQFGDLILIFIELLSGKSIKDLVQEKQEEIKKKSRWWAIFRK